MTTRLLIVPLVLASCLPAALAKDESTPTTMPTVDYVDPAFGFELNLPAAWEYDRTRFQHYRNSLGVLRGRSPTGDRSMRILVFRDFELTPFEEWLIAFGKDLGRLTNSKRIDWETWSLPPRAGAVLTFTSKIGADQTRTFYLCVPFDPSTIWVLAYSGHARSPQEQELLRREFETIINSLKIHYDPQDVERLEPAFERGQRLIQVIHEHGRRVRLDEDTYYYELTSAEKGVGYLTRQIAKEDFVFAGRHALRGNAKEGVRLRERIWQFIEDGPARYTRLDAFTSFDLLSEQIENWQKEMPPADAESQDILVRTDQVSREADVLVSSFWTSLDRNIPDPAKPIRVGPVYLDQAWVRLLPGLLLSNPEEHGLYAFAVYNSDLHGLLAYTIRLLGEAELKGHEGRTFSFEVREGFVAEPARIWTDERGVLVRLEAGELRVQRRPQAEIERKYGERQQAIMQRFNLKVE